MDRMGWDGMTEKRSRRNTLGVTRAGVICHGNPVNPGSYDAHNTYLHGSGK